MYIVVSRLMCLFNVYCCTSYELFVLMYIVLPHMNCLLLMYIVVSHMNCLF